MKIFPWLFVAAMLSTQLIAQEMTNAPATQQYEANTTIPLWPDDAPGALGKAEKDTPTLTLFLPTAEKATGAAMVICPGGGYARLAPHEGRDYARWLAGQGVACFVLKYRLRGWLSVSGADPGRRSRHPHGASPFQRMESESGPRRNYGLLGRRSRCIHDHDAFRCRKFQRDRCHRAGEFTSGSCGALLSGRQHGKICASRFKAFTARNQPAACPRGRNIR